MRPTRIDTCVVCGRHGIEHDGYAKDVRCPEHTSWARPKVPPPAPPFMRIGDNGETVNPRTGERIPPPTTEWRRAPKVVCKHCIFMMGIIAGVAIMALLR
jgi:hypothetical protein